MDAVKNIAQLLNDNVEATIVSPKKNGRYFASFLDKGEKERQNINEIDKAMTENNVKRTNFIPPAVPS